MSRELKVSRRPASGGNRGFSLAEILVVVAIIGLVVGVSIPAFLNFLKTFRVRTSGRQIAGDLQLARQRAITKTRDVYVFFRSDNLYDIIESNQQNGIPVVGVNSVRYKGPIRIAEFITLVNATGSKPTGASSISAFPNESLSGIKDKNGLFIPNYTNVPACVFLPNGAVKSVGGVWVSLGVASHGPRFSWIEIQTTSVGKVQTTAGPP